MPTFPELSLRTQRLVFRALTTQDVERIVEAVTDPETQTWLPLPNPYLTTHALTWITDHAPSRESSGVGLVRAIELDGDVAGTIDFKRTEWITGVTEIGYMTCPWARSKGVMTEAVTALSAWALRETALQRVELRIATENLAFRRVAENGRLQLRRDRAGRGLRPSRAGRPRHLLPNPLGHLRTSRPAACGFVSAALIIPRRGNSEKSCSNLATGLAIWTSPGVAADGVSTRRVDG